MKENQMNANIERRNRLKNAPDGATVTVPEGFYWDNAADDLSYLRPGDVLTKQDHEYPKWMVDGNAINRMLSARVLRTAFDLDELVLADLDMDEPADETPSAQDDAEDEPDDDLPVLDGLTGAAKHRGDALIAAMQILESRRPPSGTAKGLQAALGPSGDRVPIVSVHDMLTLAVYIHDGTITKETDQ